VSITDKQQLQEISCDQTQKLSSSKPYIIHTDYTLRPWFEALEETSCTKLTVNILPKIRTTACWTNVSFWTHGVHAVNKIHTKPHDTLGYGLQTSWAPTYCRTL